MNNGSLGRKVLGAMGIVLTVAAGTRIAYELIVAALPALGSMFIVAVVIYLLLMRWR